MPLPTEWPQSRPPHPPEPGMITFSFPASCRFAVNSVPDSQVWVTGLSLSFGRTECGDLVLFQAMVKIEDMAVSLILEEWGCQNLARRNLNRDNRQENYGNVFSQGKTDAGLLSKIVLHLLFFVSCAISDVFT